MADEEKTQTAEEEKTEEESKPKEMRDYVEELHEKRSRVFEMGGEKRIKRQHDRGKLTVRERFDLLLDEGSFFEIGIHGSEYWDPLVPADGVVCGMGKVDGRMACVAGYDFTVLGGSIGPVGERKVTRLREIALRERIPMVWLIDSAGARITPQANKDLDRLNFFADSGYLFREQVTMSGVIPLVSAMVGPGAAGTAYIPGLADFVPMTKENSSMALGGPPLVKAAIGEDVDEQDLGGPKIHTRKSGVGDLVVDDDEACIEIVKKYLSFFPSSCHEKPPVRDWDAEPEMLDDEILDLVPANPRKAYDVRKVINLLVDDADTLELKPRWARALTTTLGRIGGHPVGIVANNPKYYGGVLGNDTADKAARFVNLCDAFGIPLVFLMDVPGFMIGSKVEKEGIIRHGAKMLYAVARATVPKLTVIMRKAYGAGYYVMCGRAYEPDLFVAWPTAEISVMGAEGMVGIASRKLFPGGDMPDEFRQQMVDHIASHIDVYRAARHGFVDEVIDPRETRKVLRIGIELTKNKRVERPYRKHGVMPV